MGPDHKNVAPPALEVPLKATAVVLQVSMAPALAMAVGAVVFCETVVVAVLLQPVEASVTITVYVPAIVAMGFCAVDEKPPGPVQLKPGDVALVVALI